MLRLHPGRTNKINKQEFIVSKLIKNYNFVLIVYFYIINCNFSLLACPGRDGRCVQDLGTYSPHRNDMRLLTIPISRIQVAESDPN